MGVINDILDWMMSYQLILLHSLNAGSVLASILFDLLEGVLFLAACLGKSHPEEKDCLIGFSDKQSSA